MNGNDSDKSQSTRFLFLIRVGLMVAITVALAIAGRFWMTLVEMLCVAAARAIPVPSRGESLGHDTNPTENIVTERREE